MDREELGTRLHTHPLQQAKSVSSVVMTKDMSSEEAKYKQVSINVKPYCKRNLFLVEEASNRLFPKRKTDRSNGQELVQKPLSEQVPSKYDDSTTLVRHDSKDVESVDQKSGAVLTAISPLENAARLAASKTSSRMSIERYLNAPLEDEPASLPAISAALNMPTANVRVFAPPARPRQFSRESSVDDNSDGRRTFYTSGSNRDSTVTSYSALSKANRSTTHQHKSDRHPLPERPKSSGTTGTRTEVSPERPRTAGTIGSEKTFQEQMEQDFKQKMEKYMPAYEFFPNTSNRAKVEEELARIQAKAKSLEEKLMRVYPPREPNKEPPRVTDEMAFAQMTARPKLAWILGNEKHLPERPRSSGGVEATPRIAQYPNLKDEMSSQRSNMVRRSKSIDTLRQNAKAKTVEKRGGVILEKKHARKHRFYCTFCEKRFHDKTEWIKHEKMAHMPEELWICCPRTGEFPARCPFCSKSQPSPAHLAEHNYLSCQAKPLSERTFNKQDHFLQHINQEHKLSTWQKPIRLTELVEAWRHPLPLKEGHLALHCGFCGRTFSTYSQRTDHVAAHFLSGLDMMSWWGGRVNHVIDPLEPYEEASKPTLPQRCCYCRRTFSNLETAQKAHPTCTMWSCSFLQGMQYSIYPVARGNHVEAVCCYCNEPVVAGIEKVRIPALKEHLSQHNFRNCNQRLYFSGQRFRQHLQESHKSNYDGTLFAGWTLLLRSCRQQKPSVFEPVQNSAPVRRAVTDPLANSSKRKKNIQVPQMPKANFMDLSEQALKSPIKKLQRKASTRTLPDAVISQDSKRDQTREVRASGAIFARATTIDLAYEANNSNSSAGALPSAKGAARRQASLPTSSLPVDSVNNKANPRFYRRRLDASTRNRVYVRDANEPPLSKNSQRLFRKVPGSLFGELVLHSSLMGATPARMTNSLDIYYIH